LFGDGFSMPISRCRLAYQKTDSSAFRRRWRHEFPDRVEDTLKLGVVFPFQSSELARQLFVGSEHSAQADKGPHDFDIDLDGALATQDA